jgi:hypothetical protein
MQLSTKEYPDVSNPKVVKELERQTEKKMTAEQIQERQFLREQMRGLFNR